MPNCVHYHMLDHRVDTVLRPPLGSMGETVEACRLNVSRRKLPPLDQVLVVGVRLGFHPLGGGRRIYMWVGSLELLAYPGQVAPCGRQDVAQGASRSKSGCCCPSRVSGSVTPATLAHFRVAKQRPSITTTDYIVDPEKVCSSASQQHPFQSPQASPGTKLPLGRPIPGQEKGQQRSQSPQQLPEIHGCTAKRHVHSVTLSTFESVPIPFVYPLSSDRWSARLLPGAASTATAVAAYDPDASY